MEVKVQFSSGKKNLFDLTGSVALVTGGAGMLGKKHAEALLEMGAKVVISDINLKELEGAVDEFAECFSRESVISCEMDVTSEESIIEVKNRLNCDNLPVSILINNAALNPSASQINTNRLASRVENFSIDQWDLEVAVGLTGAFLCSRVFGSSMAESGSGVILNIASDLSVIAPDQRLYWDDKEPNPNLQPVKPITYSVIKTALIGMTRYLSSYWAGCGVRVNALSPGGVYDNQSEEFVKRLSNLIPMERMADSDEYKGAIQFLCSNASKYMTGQNIVIDGGRSIL